MGRRTANWKSTLVTIAAGGTAQAIMASSNPDRYVTDFEIHVDSTNGGPAFIGPSDVDTTTYIPRGKGTTTAFTSGHGEQLADIGFDLSKVYLISATTNDKIYVQYRKLAF